MHTMEKTRHRVGAAIAAFLLVGAASVLDISPAMAFDPAEDRTVEGAGQHVDAIYPKIDGKKLEVKSLTPEGEKDPDELALHIPTTDSSHTELPAGYDFLGEEGTEAWVTTEAQDQSVVWPGWSFEGIEQGTLQGTVSIDYDSFEYAGEADSPRFAVTQPGGFDGNKVTPLIVPGTTFTSVSGEVGAHTHATWTFTAAGTYDIDFTVNATLADGTELSKDATVRFVVGDLGETSAEPVRQKDPTPSETIDKLTVVPSKVDAEYFVGQTIDLKALSPDAADDDTYRWYLRQPGSKEAVEDTEQTTNEFSTKPIRSLDGGEAYVERVNKDGEVQETSDPITIGVRPKEPTTALTVTPDKDTYSVGDTAHFTSAQDPETEDEHYHWYLKLPGQDEYEWIPESRLADQDLKITDDMNGALITARLFNADHAVLSESPVQRISVGKGASDKITAFDVTADKDSYSVGDTAKFTADVPDEGAEVTWSVRKQGENVYSTLEGTGASLSQKVAKDWDGAEVRATVRNGDSVSAEGSSSVLSVSGRDDSNASKTSPESAFAGTVWWIAGGIVVVAIVVAVIVAVRRRGASAK